MLREGKIIFVDGGGQAMNGWLKPAWGVRGLTAAQKCVLVRLADFANDQGVAWPGQKRLAADCCLTPRSVRECVGALVEAGHLTIEKLGDGTASTVYRIHPRGEEPASGPEPGSGEGGSTFLPGRNDVPAGGGTTFRQSPITSPKELPLNSQGEVGGEFSEFWESYPRKESRKDAFKAWVKLKPDASLQAVILADVKERAASEAWTKDGGRFVPHPATYLRQERWTDAKPTSLVRPQTIYQENQF